MQIVERNRQIKKVLKQAFPGHAVTVRGSRGTAYGWVTVNIGYAPRNWQENRELTSKVMQLLSAAKIEIGTYGYDDPGSDYGYGKEIHINFDTCREREAA